jgi:two-component system sensor histidine kinase PilS (NtrC family)
MSGLLTSDPSRRITYFNPEAEQITGMRATEALGRDVDEVIPGASELVLTSQAAEPGQEPRRARMRYRNRAGEDLYLGMAASTLWDEEGAEAGHVLIFQNVTEVVAMERQLRRSERLAAVGELSAKMAHEIRNPLAAISGSVQVMRSRGNAEEGGRDNEQLMDIVVREADRLSGLIDDFLEYARSRPPSRHRVALDALVQDVVKLFEPSLPESVSLELGPLPRLIAIGDASQLKQVLWNLCLNAVQAMPDGGSLGISLASPRRDPAQAREEARRNEQGGGARSDASAPCWAEIVVADTGVGIPFEIEEQIFEPFFTTKKEGSGLGLSTVHRIVEGHGGMLQVESRQGEGTTVHVLLPQAGRVEEDS